MTSRTVRRTLTIPTGAALAALLVLTGATGCSDAGDGGAPSAPPASEPQAEPSKPSKPESTEEPEAPGAPVAPELDGVVFTDPEGRYTLEVPTAWEAHHGIAGEGIEVWLIGEVEDDFGPNINVLTEDVTGMSVGEYLDISIANAPMFMSDFEEVSSGVVTGSAGQELAVLEYTGGGLQYLGVFAMGADGAVVLTLTSTPERFAALSDEALPYLLSLQATDAG